MATTPNPRGPLIPNAHIPAAHPSHAITLRGKHVTIVGATAAHAKDIYDATSSPAHAHLFDYLFDEPYPSAEHLANKLTAAAKNAHENPSTADPIVYAILLNNPPPTTSSSTPEETKEETEEVPTPLKAVGLASLMRITPPHRTLELGSILFTPPLQRTRAATEAMYLFMAYIFEELGYTRYEWKCDALNAPSRRAAARLGFVEEGLFRGHMIVKGRGRDTVWFSVVAGEWFGEDGKEEKGKGVGPVKGAFLEWLNEGNFDEEGRQRRKLEDIRREIVERRGEKVER